MISYAGNVLEKKNQDINYSSNKTSILTGRDYPSSLFFNKMEVDKDMIIADQIKSNEVYVNIPDINDFWYLELSGRKTYYKQGYYGQGVTVAVVDSGVAPHIEFENRVLTGIDFCTDLSVSPNDDFGHGSHVAGIIGGSTCGIAPKVMILPIKVINAMGEGTIEELINALDGLYQYHCNVKPIDIVNMSLTCGSDIPENTLNKLHDIIKKLVNAGIPIIVAAGNTYSDNELYPASFPEVIAVGAVDKSLTYANFSTRSKEVDLCQIGTEVISCYKRNNEYAVFDGTSMATPMITGIASLLICKYKALFNKQMPDSVLYEALRLNCIDIDTAGIDTKTGAGFCTLSPGLSVMKLKENEKMIDVNGVQIESDVPSIMVNNRFLIPARFIAEHAGGAAFWNNNEQIGTIIL